MVMQPVVIGDAASLSRDIAPTDFIAGWKTTGAPADAVSIDTFEDLLNIRLRPTLTAIILADAPTGLTLQDLSIVSPLNLTLDYMVAGHAAQLSTDLTVLFPTVGLPENIGAVADLGSDDAFPHFDHVHRLPSRTQGETPIIGLEHLAAAPPAGYGRRIAFNATTGVPEFADEVSGATLSSATPEPVGGPGTPAVGTDPAAPHADHGHGIAARAIGFAELAAAPTVADRGRAIGFDATTGDPTTLDAGGGTFLSQTDTPNAFGTAGQVPEVNSARNGLEFSGPYQPLLAPAPPTNLRATDAFDMALENRWNPSGDAVSYEWQRKSSSAAWPTTAGTNTTDTMVRATAVPLGTYDFRVRSVGHGGVLASAWVEITNIPLIATPTPAASTSNVLSRVRSQTLRFVWDNLDVNNGGVGAARVVKSANYDYQYREVGALSWGNLVAHNASSNVQVNGLTNGTEYEMRVMGSVERSDATRTEVDGPWSAESNAVRPVKDNLTLTYGVSASRTGAIISPRSIEVPLTGGTTFEITNAANPSTDGQFYVLDLSRGDEYAHDYNLTALETRPLPTDITAGAAYVAEMEPATGPRRYSVGPAAENNQTQVWYIEVA